MTTFEVAHLREQGQDIIIVVVADAFGSYGNIKQNQLCQLLQEAASSAGLAGTVVPVWDAGFGRLGFLAPNPWHSYFRGLTLADVAVNINRELMVNW